MGILTKAAARFVAGETIEDAVRVVKELNAKGITVTLDHLGEDVKDERQATESADEYLRILDEIERHNLNSNVSIKLSQMGLLLSESFCEKNVRRIVQRAADMNNFVRIDMEGSDLTQKTLDLFYTLHSEFGDAVGIVIQAYLYRSEKDIQDLIERKAKVRLCKGAYKEPKDIAFPSKEEVNKNYVKLAKMLLKSDAYHGIATHDEKIIEELKRFCADEGIEKDHFEFQMLYGIARKLQLKLVEEGYNMRVYVPYGTDWLPYYRRRLMERKENVMFVLKHFLKG